MSRTLRGLKAVIVGSKVIFHALTFLKVLSLFSENYPFSVLANILLKKRSLSNLIETKLVHLQTNKICFAFNVRAQMAGIKATCNGHMLFPNIIPKQ